MADAIVSEKQCLRCGEVKPLDQYKSVNRTKTKPQGNLSARCIGCLRVYKRAHKEKVASATDANPLPPDAPRVCTGCGETKPAAEFHKSRHHKGGYVCKCRVCVTAYKNRNKAEFYAKAQAYRDANREDIRRKKIEWRTANPEINRRYSRQSYLNNQEKRVAAARSYRLLPGYLERKREQDRKWRAKNPDRLKVYNERRMEAYHSEKKFDPRFVLNRRVRLGIAKSLRGKKDRRPWESLVGYTLDDLVKHLKKTMPKGYTWDDLIAGRLHIDHRDPVSAFNFDSHTDIDFQRCWSLKNLRLIPAFDNLSKGSKILSPIQTSFTGI
jgi:hypothetical protein